MCTGYALSSFLRRDINLERRFEVGGEVEVKRNMFEVERKVFAKLSRRCSRWCV